MKTVQYFTDEYLKNCRKISLEERFRYLEEFKQIAYSEKKNKTKLISIKIETDLLNLFKIKTSLEKQRYQTKIKELMREYCLS